MPFDVHGALLVAVVAGVTALIRFLPFVVFGGGRSTPRFIVYLAGVLPCAIMAMLVVYCLRGVDLLGPTHGLPELLAGAAEEEYIVEHRRRHGAVYGAGADGVWVTRCRGRCLPP